MILINDYQNISAVKTSLVKGANYLSYEKTSIGNKTVLEVNFETLDNEWYNVSDWTKVAQNRIAEPIPNAITINKEDTMFLMGGFLHGALNDTTVPEFSLSNNENIFSDLLASSILALSIEDYSTSYLYLQTWLFFMNRFTSEFRQEMSLTTSNKLIIPFNL